MAKGPKNREASSSRSPSSPRPSSPSPNISSSQRLKKSSNSRRKLSKEENQVQKYINKKVCQICQLKDNEEQLLLCDRCDDSYHIRCLDPPMHQLPEEQQWICPACQKQLQTLNSIKMSKMSKQPQMVCHECNQPLNRKQFIKGLDVNNQPVQIQCKSLVDLICAYCKHSFHNTCFSQRKNSLNCRHCQKQIRTNGPKSHDQFMKYIDRSIEEVKNSDHSLLEHSEQNENIKRHRYFRLKVPAYMTSWQFIVQYEASLYYAFATKRLTFIDDQIYYNEEKDNLMKLNSPERDCNEMVYRLSDKDEKAYEQFKINSKKGYVGPFEVKEDRVKGFYLVATDYIEPFTIVSQYSGEVMTSKDALNYEENDSIFMLIRGHRSIQSLDIVPQKYGNISRFFSGINNSLRRSLWSKLENIKSLRFSYKGRVHLLLHTIKPIQAGQTLYFDYNGSTFHEYPTDHFIQ